MRYALPISLILLFCSLAAQAQETEMRINQILNPSKNSSSYLQNKSFYGGTTFQSSGSAYVKGFTFNEYFAPKSFSTRSYGSNSFWAGNSKFGTVSANTKGNYEIPNVSKSVDTKTGESKTAQLGDKSYPLRGYETSDFRGQGKSQKSLDQQNAPKKAMSIDQVRELLNKNQ